MRRRSLVLLTAASTGLVVGIIGCASNSTQPSATIPTPVADGKPCQAAQLTVATTPPGTDAAGSTLPPGTVDKPKVTMPEGLPPTELKTIDEKVGTGAEVKKGDTVTVNYVGVSCSTGKQFDSSWDSGEPATFQLDGVIPGWGEGMVGMKEGGRRVLVIPPGKAYGDKPTSEDILPGETLVFVVDLQKTETPPPTTTTTAAPATTAAPSESPGSTAASTSSTAP
jgi:peptidylprolyl isomerase